MPIHMLIIYDYECGVHMHIDLQQLNGIAVVIRTCAYNVKRELRGVLPDVLLSCVCVYIYIYNKLYYITLYNITHILYRYYCRSHRIIYMYDILFLSFFRFIIAIFLHPATPLQTICNTSNWSHKKCLMVKNRVLEIYSLMAFKRIYTLKYVYTILL
jgi:hypothetical protein